MNFVVTKESAVNIAKWLVQQKANDPKTGMMRRMALNGALSSGGIEEIFDEVHRLGFKIVGDDNNPTHQQWLQAGALQRDPDC